MHGAVVNQIKTFSRGVAASSDSLEEDNTFVHNSDRGGHAGLRRSRRRARSRSLDSASIGREIGKAMGVLLRNEWSTLSGQGEDGGGQRAAGNQRGQRSVAVVMEGE